VIDAACWKHIQSASMPLKGNDEDQTVPLGSEELEQIVRERMVRWVFLKSIYCLVFYCFVWYLILPLSVYEVL
jgi:hypothetical protein